MEAMQRMFRNLGEGLLSYMGYSSSFQNPTFEGTDMECPICFQIPNEEIHQCKNGHMICASCSSEVDTCPQCRCDLEVDGVLIRNRFAESLVAKIVIPCPAAEDGCTFQGNRDQTVLHKKDCKHMIHAITLCKLLGYKCHFLTRSSQKEKVIKHFEECHEAKHFRMEEEFLRLTYKKMSDLCEGPLLKAFGPTLITIPDNTSFLVYLNKVNGFVAWSCLQLDNSTKLYEFEFHVPSLNEKTRPIVLREPVKTMEDMKLDNGEIGLRLDDLQTLYTLDDEFKAAVSIYRATKPKRIVVFNK